LRENVREAFRYHSLMRGASLSELTY